MVGAHHRPVRQAGHRPGRPGGHRAPLPRPAGHPAPAGARAVLRLARPQQAPAHDPGRAARGPLPRAPDRRDRPGGAAHPELADHRHRPYRRSAREATGRRAGHQHSGFGGQQRLRRLRLHRARSHPRRRGAGAAVPGAHLHQHRDPARRGTPGAALRRDAADRRHTPAGFGDLRRGSVAVRAGRRGRRLRPLPAAAPAAAGHPVVHRRAVRPRRPVAAAGRRPGRGDRRPGGGGGRGPGRAAARADLPARGDPPGHPARSPRLAGDPAAGGPRRARLLRLGRACPRAATTRSWFPSWDSC